MADRVGPSRRLGAFLRHRRRYVAVVAALGSAIGPAQLVFATGRPGAVTSAQIGRAPAVPSGAVRVAGPAGGTALRLAVSLRSPNPTALTAFVTAVSTPGSPQYHHYLRKGQFGSVFGASQSTIDAVTHALTAAGLQAGPATPDRLTIPVTTTVAQARAAFGIDFAGYRLADGRTGYANTAAPRLPSPIAGTVAGILGLNDIVKAVAHHTKPRVVVGVPAAAATAAASLAPAVSTPTVCAGVRNGLANQALLDTRDYWQPGSLAASTAYGTGPLNTRYGDVGSGVTVGIYELEAYNPRDISEYQSCFNTHVPVSAIRVDGGPSLAPTGGVGVESVLDIQTILGLAPGVSINVYQGPDAQAATDAQALDVYARMINDDTAQVISTSWGICEFDLNRIDPAVITAEGNLFAQAAAQGQTVVAASGDGGSTSCYHGLGNPQNPTLSVDDPANQPAVTGVGGTTMVGGSTGQSAWNSNSGGTGGGVSAVLKLAGQANYQAGLHGPGYQPTDCGASTGQDCRQVPDVAAVADPSTGYLIKYGYDSHGAQSWFPIGGTSGAAPLWAAIAALADASHSCAANGPVGFLNPALYQDPAALTDITTGNNDVTASGYTAGLYVAGTGYDLTTGLGTPKAPQLVEALCGARTATPGAAFTPAGPVRVLDTRSGAPIGSGGQLSLHVTGSNGVPDSAAAVVLNVTATEPTGNSFLTVWPDGQPRPSSSNLNFTPGTTIPNLVTVPVGAHGNIDIWNHVGSAHVVADLFGYYATGTGSLYQPVSPVRVLDTRTAVGVPTTTPIGAGGQLSLQVAGANGVPPGNVAAVVLNVTATQPTSSSFLTVWPDGTPRPSSSNLNFTPGTTIPNLVTVPVGANGRVDIWNHFGTVHVVGDLFGYFTGDGAGFRFHPSPPRRLADTRTGVGLPNSDGGPVGPGGTVALPLTDVAGAGNAGPLSTAAALVLNVTATQPTDNGFVTVYPSNVPRPTSSNLNFVPAQTIPNAVVTPVDGTSINFFNHLGSIQLVVDLFGYYATT